MISQDREVRRRAKRLDALCAAGRPSYFPWVPFGYEVAVDLGGDEDVELHVEAECWPHDAPQRWGECPGARGGWVVHSVWMERHGAWVDIMPRMTRKTVESIVEQLRGRT
jgi:hypothetical protein